MKIIEITVKVLRKSYRVLFNKRFINPICEFNRQSANDQIYSLLMDDRPCMIARFGSTELIAINNYLCINSNKHYFGKILNYILGNTHLPWWEKGNFRYMDVFSGVFPATEDTMNRFSKRYLDDIPLIDALGSWQYFEKFMPLKKDLVNLHLETLYPFFVEKPWTRALKGKKILIVHPFDETIKRQYKNKIVLFENSDILPDFDLISFKAVQSAAGIKPSFSDWFKALAFMEDKISKIDFDICILGCGAYGLPLAAHVKRMGKKSFHIGGGLQLLFGIKGKRWDNPDYLKLYGIPELATESYFSLYNDNWIRPLPVDTPSSAEKLDGATYW